jgi:hypothetical protein
MTPYQQLQARLQATPATWLVTDVAGCRGVLADSLDSDTVHLSRRTS